MGSGVSMVRLYEGHTVLIPFPRGGNWGSTTKGTTYRLSIMGALFMAFYLPPPVAFQYHHYIVTVSLLPAKHFHSRSIWRHRESQRWWLRNRDKSQNPLDGHMLWSQPMSLCGVPIPASVIVSVSTSWGTESSSQAPLPLRTWGIQPAVAGREVSILGVHFLSPPLPLAPANHLAWLPLFCFSEDQYQFSWRVSDPGHSNHGEIDAFILLSVFANWGPGRELDLPKVLRWLFGTEAETWIHLFGSSVLKRTALLILYSLVHAPNNF